MQHTLVCHIKTKNVRSFCKNTFVRTTNQIPSNLNNDPKTKTVKFSFKKEATF